MSSMDALPQELVDNILAGLFQHDFAITARFRTLRPDARQAILNCRLVQRRWSKSKILDILFTEVLAETPFIWRNHSMPALEAIADTKWGSRLRLLSICGRDMGLITESPAARWGVDRKDMEKKLPITEYLVNLLCKLGSVFRLRHYPIHPKCLDGTWPNWKVSQSDRHEERCRLYDDGRPAYPSLAPGEQS